MAFKKATGGQSKLKVGLYGKQGSGKTLTALMIAEGLAKREGKRIAYVDTERGTDFYCRAIPERKAHPGAFDFDAIYTRSICQVLDEVKSIDPATHGVLIIDSMTHIWEATVNAYTGKRTSHGSIPVQAWSPLKKPYKQLMSLFLDGDFHAILCGREGVLMDKDDDGELEVVGTKMKAEGETGYEPHVLVHMKSQFTENEQFEISAFFEKDRSGILTGKKITWPSFATVEPIVAHLCDGAQVRIGTVDDAAEQDAAAIEAAGERETQARQTLFEQIRGAVVNSRSVDELKSAWELTKGKKGKLGELFETLEITKDGRKAELLKAVA